MARARRSRSARFPWRRRWWWARCSGCWQAIAAAILTEAALSFLGLGNPPPAPSWGNMLATGYQFMETTVWPSVVPGFAIMLAVLGFNLLGDGLRDIIDPTTRD